MTLSPKKLPNSADKLSQVYIVALMLVAMLSIGGFCAVQSVVNAGKYGATLVNIGGRQRRLSQQVALFTLQAATARDEAERTQAKAQLKEVLDLLEHTHDVLSHGKAEFDLSKGVSDSVKEIYFGPKANLDDQMVKFLSHSHAVLSCPPANLSRDNADVQYILKEGPGKLLDTLTMLVKQYEVDSQREIESINKVETLFLTMTLLLLGAEALFIFRPMSRRINVQMKELLDSQQELSAVFDTVGEALLTMDVDNSVITANHQVETIWGANRDAVVGKKIDAFIRLDSNDRALTAGEHLGRRLEVEGVRPNGNSFPLEITITKTNLSDRVLFTASARDLTERKAVENRISEFYSTVSHELRTPLTTIRGALGVMDGGLTGELPPKAQVFVKMACEESERLVRLINDFLDLRKIAAGMLSLRIDEACLVELTKTAITNLAPLAEPLGITVEESMPETAPLSADKDRVIQIITNLLSNAIKFSPRDAVIKISVVPTADQKSYRVEIEDSGTGIPSDQMDKLFGMFQQLDSSDKRPAGGTGLGLAISKALVTRHGGTIGARSDGKTGSVFWFELPIKPPAQPQPRLNLTGTEVLQKIDYDEGPATA